MKSRDNFSRAYFSWTFLDGAVGLSEFHAKWPDDTNLQAAMANLLDWAFRTDLKDDTLAERMATIGRRESLKEYPHHATVASYRKFILRRRPRRRKRSGGQTSSPSPARKQKSAVTARDPGPVRAYLLYKALLELRNDNGLSLLHTQALCAMGHKKRRYEQDLGDKMGAPSEHKKLFQRANAAKGPLWPRIAEGLPHAASQAFSALPKGVEVHVSLHVLQLGENLALAFARACSLADARGVDVSSPATVDIILRRIVGGIDAYLSTIAVPGEVPVFGLYRSPDLESFRVAKTAPDKIDGEILRGLERRCAETPRQTRASNVTAKSR